MEKRCGYAKLPFRVLNCLKSPQRYEENFVATAEWITRDAFQWGAQACMVHDMPMNKRTRGNIT